MTLCRLPNACTESSKGSLIKPPTKQNKGKGKHRVASIQPLHPLRFTHLVRRHEEKGPDEVLDGRLRGRVARALRVDCA